MRDYLSSIHGLLGYQVESTEHALNVVRQRRRAIMADDMGVGKTYKACAVARELDLPTLVIAPKSSLTKWERVGDYVGGGVTAINYEQLIRCKTPFGEFYEDRGHKRWRWNPAVQFVIFDECHRCGGTSTGNSKLMIAARHQNLHGLALSATAAETPLRMKALGFFLGLFGPDESVQEELVMTRKGLRRRLKKSMAVAEPFQRWASRYGCRDGWDGWGYYGDPEDMQRLHRDIFPECGGRQRIEDIPGFPETQITAELIDLGGAETDKVQRNYDSMDTELAALAAKTADWNLDMGSLACSEQRQRIDLLKVPAYLEAIQDAIQEGQSVALFVPYRATVEAVCSRLEDTGIPFSKIWGGQSAKERDEQINRFSLDVSRVCVNVNDAGCESIDLHDIRGQYPRLAIITPPYEAWKLRQIVGRVRRAGGKSKSLQRIWCARGTYEERVYNTLVEKSLNLDALNDGDLDPTRYILHGRKN